MNIEDALILAKHIEANVAGVTVVAIGRFVEPEHINPYTPWKISVVVEGVKRPKIVTSEESLRSLVEWSHEQRRASVAPGMLF